MALWNEVSWANFQTSTSPSNFISTRYHACPFGRCCPVRTSSRDSVLYRQWILYPKPAQPCFQFPYSIQYQDEANRPPLLKYSVFNGQDKYKLKQTAEQASIFLKYLPFCIRRYVCEENPHFQLILQMQSIVLICFSPVVSGTTVQQLEDTIETHLKQFNELFPMVNVTPQMHYLIHLPKLDPPTKPSWTTNPTLVCAGALK